MWRFRREATEADLYLFKEGTTLSRETSCRCCGKTFTAKLMIGIQILPISIGDNAYYQGYCEKCQKKIDTVDWFGHHRKAPTMKELDKELRKRIEYLESLR